MPEPIAMTHRPDLADVRAALMDDLAGLAADLDAALAEIAQSVAVARAALADGHLPDTVASFAGQAHRVVTLDVQAHYAWIAARQHTGLSPEHLGNVVKVAVVRRRQDERAAAPGEGAAR